MAQKTRKITINPAKRAHARKLSRLLEDGWEIVSQHRRGIFQWKPGQVDYLLVKKN